MSKRIVSPYKPIYDVIRKIPRGKVATYGQIAEMSGRPKQPRQVGYALHAIEPGSKIPWHRVVNAKGQVSPRSSGDGHFEDLQRESLEEEGIEFSDSGKIDLSRFLWKPKSGIS